MDDNKEKEEDDIEIKDIDNLSLNLTHSKMNSRVKSDENEVQKIFKTQNKDIEEPKHYYKYKKELQSQTNNLR